MKIRFFDGQQRKLVDVLVDANDHWEACELGHDILAEEKINGAEDFQVMEISHSSPFVHLARDEKFPIMERLRKVA